MALFVSGCASSLSILNSHAETKSGLNRNVPVGFNQLYSKRSGFTGDSVRINHRVSVVGVEIKGKSRNADLLRMQDGNRGADRRMKAKLEGLTRSVIQYLRLNGPATLNQLASNVIKPSGTGSLKQFLMLRPDFFTLRLGINREEFIVDLGPKLTEDETSPEKSFLEEMYKKSTHPESANLMFVDTVEKARDALKKIVAQPVLGVSVEYIGKNADDKQVSLIALNTSSGLSTSSSYPLGTVYVLDMMVSNAKGEIDADHYDEVLRLAKTALEDDSKLKVMHACRDDIQVLKKCLKINVQNVLDTQVAYGTLLDMRKQAEGSTNAIDFSVPLDELLKEYGFFETETDVDFDHDEFWRRRPFDLKMATVVSHRVKYLLKMLYLINRDIAKITETSSYRKVLFLSEAYRQLEHNSAWKKISKRNLFEDYLVSHHNVSNTVPQLFAFNDPSNAYQPKYTGLFDTQNVSSASSGSSSADSASNSVVDAETQRILDCIPPKIASAVIKVLESNTGYSVKEVTLEQNEFYSIELESKNVYQHNYALCMDAAALPIPGRKAGASIEKDLDLEVDIVVQTGSKSVGFRDSPNSFSSHRKRIGEIVVDSVESFREVIDFLKETQPQIFTEQNRNRFGLSGMLHSLSVIRNRSGDVSAVTFRVSKPHDSCAQLVQDVIAQVHVTREDSISFRSKMDPDVSLQSSKSLDQLREEYEEQESDQRRSVLVLGPPGSGRSSLLRGVAERLINDFKKRVVIIDTHRSIGGDNDVALKSLGNALRLVLPDDASRTQDELIHDAVLNHCPDVLIIDEIGNAADVSAVKLASRRGISVVAGVSGNRYSCFRGLILGQSEGFKDAADIDALMSSVNYDDPMLGLVGGVQRVRVPQKVARKQNMGRTEKLQRSGPSLFQSLIEVKALGQIHLYKDLEPNIDRMLAGDTEESELRMILPDGSMAAQLNYDPVRSFSRPRSAAMGARQSAYASLTYGTAPSTVAWELTTQRAIELEENMELSELSGVLDSLEPLFDLRITAHSEQAKLLMEKLKESGEASPVVWETLEQSQDRRKKSLARQFESDSESEEEFRDEEDEEDDLLGDMDDEDMYYSEEDGNETVEEDWSGAAGKAPTNVPAHKKSIQTRRFSDDDDSDIDFAAFSKPKRPEKKSFQRSQIKSDDDIFVDSGKKEDDLWVSPAAAKIRNNRAGNQPTSRIQRAASDSDEADFDGFSSVKDPKNEEPAVFSDEMSSDEFEFVKKEDTKAGKSLDVDDFVFDDPVSEDEKALWSFD